ncbi:hypothetical protein ACFQBQ_06385 [Granulicella cerasi]|uniref:Uncharacterized protein n=1 Tax=Granulicella cerasi TaxID=741063 RepID=A0ABW1Z6X8_9BACT|nr:hypothetical protein [Granulicella cerasi]
MSRSRVLMLAGLAASASVLLSGCGMGSSTTASNSIANVSGTVHGGPQGDANASITLYATTTAAYGTGGTVLASTTTDQFGFFNFGNSAAVCPTGQQAYIVVTGGNPGLGAGQSNPNITLMAALGDCSGISTATSIYINEATTVAAGYALSNFMSVDTAGVHVSAPSTNNAQTGTCVVNSTTGLSTCTAAGLRHAFMNALNLVNSVSADGSSTPTGMAYTTIPGNTSSTVPTLLINTLSNILMSCVNSTGGAAGDSTNCGKLFTATTPPTTSAVSPVTPTNTLQAVLNLAKYPTLTPANVSATFALASGFTYYTPSLATVPSDYSMAIAYQGPVSGTTYQYGFYTVTDINDTTYTMAQTASSGAGNTRIDALSPYGGASYQGPIISAIGCAAASPCEAGVDTVGNIWLANTVSTASNVYQISTSNGSLVNTTAVSTAANSAAVDKYNNVYVTSALVTGPNVFMKAAGSSTFAAVASETQATPEYITVAADGSVWNANYNTSNVQASYIQNTSTGATPTLASPVLATGGATSSAYGISFDAAGNTWVNGLSTLYSIVPGQTTAAGVYAISGIGGSGTGATKAATSARFHAQDGDGNIFLPDNGQNVVYQYFPGTHSFVYLVPCTGNTGTACLTAGQRVAASRNAEVDATGSIWISNPSATVANGNIVQIIGTAAPAWGQRSYQKIGSRP